MLRINHVTFLSSFGSSDVMKRLKCKQLTLSNQQPINQSINQ